MLGLARRGFFIPYRYADRLPCAGARQPYPVIEARLAAAALDFAQHVTRLAKYADALTALGDAPAPAPRWDQDWFPRLDGAMAYALTRELRPARIVEVGSGHSTRFFARAIADARLSTRLTAIDPAPRATLAGLSVEWLRDAVPNVGMAPFAALASGDFLIIDSSHVLMPGSDVDFLINRVLPLLPLGVLVHLHDVFLPDDYPAEWDWRGYNEQLAIAALLAGGTWQVRFASHYVATRLAQRVADSVASTLPLPAGAHESSLWIERSR
jgi:hypothetical protein